VTPSKSEVAAKPIEHEHYPGVPPTPKNEHASGYAQTVRATREHLETYWKQNQEKLAKADSPETRTMIRNTLEFIKEKSHEEGLYSPDERLARKLQELRYQEHYHKLDDYEKSQKHRAIETLKQWGVEIPPEPAFPAKDPRPKLSVATETMNIGRS